MKRLTLLLAVVVLAGPTLAGMGNLGNEIPGFTGQSQFRASYLSGDKLDVDVDFAVFAPNDFQSSAQAYSGFSAPAASEYVYAYQLHNLPTSTVPLSFFGIDLDPTTIISGVGFNDSEGNKNASGATQFSFAIRYNFVPQQLLKFDDSYFLLYSSPYPPQFSNGSIIDGGLSQMVEGIPAPVPEPTTGALALLGLAAVQSCRRRLA